MKGSELRETLGLLAVVASLGFVGFDLIWTGVLSLGYIKAAWPSMRYSYESEFADFFDELLVRIPESRAPRIWDTAG